MKKKLLSVVPCIFRYPGGKSKRLRPIRRNLDPLLKDARLYAEPFWGGGSVGLSVAKDYPDIEIWLSDLDEYISSFWDALVSGTDEEFQRLLDFIRQVPTIELFKELRQSPPKDKIERAYHAVFFNRCTFSGISRSGPLGGWQQDGLYKIGDRYNRERIITDCAEARTLLRGRTTVFNKDAVELIREVPDDAVLFIDPPYVQKGKSLYRKFFEPKQHRALMDVLRGRTRWVTTYDKTPEVEALYSWATLSEMDAKYSIRSFNKSHAATSEYIITPPALAGEPSSEVIFWSSSSIKSPENRQPVPAPTQTDAESGLGQAIAPAISMATGSTSFVEHEYLTTKEAAAYMRRSKSWLLHQKDIPYLRGTPNTYRKSDLDAWFERNMTQMP